MDLTNFTFQYSLDLIRWYVTKGNTEHQCAKGIAYILCQNIN